MENSFKSVLSKLEGFKISDIGLVTYILMGAVLLIAIHMKLLPNTLIGAIISLFLMGNLLYFIGAKLPIFRSYLGGGSVFTILGAAILAMTGIVPAGVVHTASNFINNMDFLSLFIVSLIASAIFKMDRNMLLKSCVRFLPVAFLSMIVTFFVVGIVGALIGNGFSKSIFYIAIPAMSGGVGAGIVPLSGIYSSALGTVASKELSHLFPTVILANLIAIILAGIISNVFKNSKYDGHGQLLRTDEPTVATKEEVQPKYTQIGVGMAVAMTFFLLGTILHQIIPGISAFAFIILAIVLVKALGVVPSFYEDATVMFGQVVTKNMTRALLMGVGLSLLDMNTLIKALTWRFILLVLISVLTITITAACLGKLFGLYPLESAITAGLVNNSMGGTGNVSVLAASNRMELIAFAQMGNRIGGAIVLVVAGILISFMH